MRTKLITILVLLGVVLGACATPATPIIQTVEVPKEVVTTVEVEKEVVKTVEVEKVVEVTPTPGPNPEAVIPNVEDGAEITFWTFYLSPTFDNYIKDTIARFEEAYPGVKVNWADHQATFRDDLNACLRRLGMLPT